MKPHRVVSALPSAGLFGLLSAWAGLTVLRQASISVPWLARYEAALSVGVPIWRFFGPNPGMYDRDILVRHRAADGTAGPWRRLHLARRRRVWHMVWAPHRRVEKSVTDLVSGLTQIWQHHLHRPIVESTMPYRALLNLVTHQVQHDRHATEIQFGIFETCRYDDSVIPRITFMSGFHELPPADQHHIPGMTGPTGARSSETRKK